MNDFDNEIVLFCITKGYEFDIIEIENSPYLGLRFLEKSIIVHLIPIFSETKSYFFQNISLQYQKEKILVIHLHQDIWQKKQQIVRSRLGALLGHTERIFARKTKIIRITQPELDKFLHQNHLHDTTKAKIKLGLKFQDKLVAVASFSLPRKIFREKELYKSGELIRYASLLNITVTGGLSKLLKHYEENYMPDDVMTYADMDWSDGTNYEKLGFNRLGITAPKSFSITDSYERVANTETNNLVWNSGNIKFLKILKKI